MQTENATENAMPMPPRGAIRKAESLGVETQEQRCYRKTRGAEKEKSAAWPIIKKTGRFAFALAAATLTWSALQIARGILWAQNKKMKISILAAAAALIAACAVSFCLGSKSAAWAKGKERQERAQGQSKELPQIIAQQGGMQEEIAVAPPEKPVTPPKVMNEEAFAKELNSVFSKTPESRFRKIYKAVQDINAEPYNSGMPPYYAAGIAWKETGFNPGLTSPPTDYGYSRGMFQVLDSTGRIFGVSNPQDEYLEDVNIPTGIKILHTYKRWLSGREPGGDLPRLPERFKAFSVVEGVNIAYNGKLVTDQNGQAVPLDLVTALAYNGGADSIINALKAHEGVLIMDPSVADYKDRHISIQQLDYALKINAYMYNFGYKFPYEQKDIPKEKIF